MRLQRHRSHSASPPRVRNDEVCQCGNMPTRSLSTRFHAPLLPIQSHQQDDMASAAAASVAAADMALPPRQFGERTSAKAGHETVRVVCRFRPENDYEQKHGEFCVDFEGQTKVFFCIDCQLMRCILPLTSAASWRRQV